MHKSSQKKGIVLMHHSKNENINHPLALKNQLVEVKKTHNLLSNDDGLIYQSRIEPSI